jgi:hypothetical protein
MYTKFWFKNIKGIPTHIWEKIRIDVKERGQESVDWIHLAQDRVQWQALANTVMNLWVP